MQIEPDQLPCIVIATDHAGTILFANRALNTLTGSTWVGRSLDELLPLPARIFAQTHIWPMLLRNGAINEVYMEVLDAHRNRVPVMANGVAVTTPEGTTYQWVLFVARERSRFENEIVAARSGADAAAAAHAKSERFVRTITDALPGFVAYCDPDLICRFVNATGASWFGRQAEDVVGGSISVLIGEHLFAANEPRMREALAGRPQEFERAARGRDGRPRHLQVRYIPDQPVPSAPPVGFFALIDDITSIRAAESEQRLAASVVENTLDAIMITATDGTIQSVNPAFTTITGYSAAEALGQTPSFFASVPKDSAVAEHAEVRRAGSWEGEVWNRRPDGEVFLAWQRTTAIPGTGDEPARYVSLFNDITERWRQDERLRRLALHDALTGLPNRALVVERISRLLGARRRESRVIAVLFIDLDGFKAINDTRGHHVGDVVLKVVAERLVKVIRSTDSAARLGGDEFVVLLDNPVSRPLVGTIAGRLIAAIRRPIEVDGITVTVGASLGIAMHPDDGATAAELISSADAAMYVAKAAGKDRLHFSSGDADHVAPK